MAESEDHSSPSPYCPTQRADYSDFPESAESFPYLLTQTTSHRELSELPSCAQIPRVELDESSGLFSYSSPLESTLKNDAPMSPTATDDYNHCGCSDIDEDFPHHPLDDEDDVVLISPQSIEAGDASSPMKQEHFYDSTQESSIVNCKHIGDTTESDLSSAPICNLVPSQKILAQDMESIMREPSFVLGLLIGTILQSTAQGSSSESGMPRLATQYSSQNRRIIPDGTTKVSKHPKAKFKASSRSRKRKLEAKSEQEAQPRPKKIWRSSRQPEGASYKPMVAILTDECATTNHPIKWEYGWNMERKLWIARKAPQEMREWRREELLSLVHDLTVRVRPNSDWLPVDMHWREGGEGEEDVFEGSDILGENGWTYQITSAVMLQMLSEGATGQGIVTKW